jgi:L-lactate dehydrogenase complex protein LldE
MTVALFVPCFVDQFYPQAGIAAVHVLERLGIDVAVPNGAACCGQPVANAGFEALGAKPLEIFERTFAQFERIVVLSGSCTTHLRAHLERDAHRVVEFCAFLHDEVGRERIAALGVSFPRRVAVHIGCHALRGLSLATPSEIQAPRDDKVRGLLSTVRDLEMVDLQRPDECCGFGGTFSVTEPDVSAKMGRDRLGDVTRAGADVIVSTDNSCVMHLQGLARRNRQRMTFLHVAQVLAGEASSVAV